MEGKEVHLFKAPKGTLELWTTSSAIEERSEQVPVLFSV